MRSLSILRTASIAIAATLVLASFERAAHAQPSEDGIALKLAYAHSSVDNVSGSAFDMNAAALLGFGSFGVGAEIGAVVGSVSDISNTTKFKFLNPWLGGYYIVNLEVAKLEVGAGLSLPVLSLSDSSVTDFAAEAAMLQTALSGRGAWNSWMYLPKATTVVVPARLSVGLLGLVGVAAEGAVAINHRGDVSASLPGAMTTISGGNDFIYQVAGEAYLGLGFEPGLRVQWVHIPTASVDNNIQVSVIPFVRVGFGPAHAEAAFLYNVTNPYGPSFSDSAGTAHAYSLHIGASVSI
jgi:hypothetical protein